VTEIASLSARELSEAYRERELSPTEVIQAHIETATRVGPALNALAATCFDRALAEAKEADARFADATARPLEGVPLVVKDLFDTAAVATSYGSPMFAGHVPDRDADAVARARNAGAIVIAKTSTDEFAYGITSHNPHLGAVRNPWAIDRVSGGSSGGSAAAISAGVAPLALGSDTGGSIRVPAAFCGVIGHKPTFGAVSNDGLFPMARSLDHTGPLARTPADARLLLESIAEFPLDDAATGRLRVGVCRDLHLIALSHNVNTAFGTALAALREAGADVIDLDYPDAERIWPTFLTTQRAETSFTHRRRGLYPDRRDGYGDDVRARLDEAAKVSLDEYLDAQAEREQLRARFERLFEQATVIVAPLQADTPPLIGSHDVEEVTRQMVMDHTVPQDLFGNPACAVRAGFDDLGVPIGVQLVGRRGGDLTVLTAAERLFDATADLQARRPPLERAK
jgi:aspartyl-tRNA(Asn)/glutamyl-tRNA(Gln) amidotransferase subunit A